MFLLIALALVVAPEIAYATTVKPFGFERLCLVSQTIAHVRCLEIQSVEGTGGEGIYTLTRFEVMEIVKGPPKTQVVLMLPGGEVAGRRLEVPGMPRFSVGQETVLFLSEPDAGGFPWPIGLGQGCVGVAMDARGVRYVKPGWGKHFSPGVRDKPTIPKKMALGDFLREVRGVMKTAPGTFGDHKESGDHH